MSSLLVPIVKIEKIEKHPNADTLSIANFEGMGWNCIIKTDSFQVGDLAIYIPIDCVVPQSLIEEYDLAYLKNGGRITTVKLRGCVSQGLLLTLRDKPFQLGENVAEKLGVKKWEPPVNQQLGRTNRVKNANSNFNKYTDIENIKNYFNVFEDDEEEVVITEKIHGTNARFGMLPANNLSKNIFTMFFNKIKSYLFDSYEFCYGSHNVQLGALKNNDDVNEDSVWSKMAKKYNLNKIIPKDYIVYGEIVGPGIQDLIYGLEDIDLYVFDIKYKGVYLSYDEMIEFCNKFNLKTVPLLYRGPYNKDLLLTYTDGQSLLCPKQIREGCVIKPTQEKNDKMIGRKILKSVSVKYLTRKNGTEYH